MVFRRTVIAALLVGLLAGLFLSLLQTWQVVPIILEAEKYEVAHGHDDGQAVVVWAPEDGWERTLYTVFSNILAACGFAMVLIALMAVRRQSVSILAAAGWGVAGFFTFFMLPSLGLEPEIPGMETAALLDRQIWWLFSVVCTGTGLAILVFVRPVFKIFGAVIMTLPFWLMVPPLANVPSFADREGLTQQMLLGLAEQFVYATTWVNALYWLILGVLSGVGVTQYIARNDAMRTG